jgi:hypothetical protein
LTFKIIGNVKPDRPGEVKADNDKRYYPITEKEMFEIMKITSGVKGGYVGQSDD